MGATIEFNEECVLEVQQETKSNLSQEQELELISQAFTEPRRPNNITEAASAVVLVLAPTQASVQEIPGAQTQKYHNAAVLSLSPGRMADVRLELPGVQAQKYHNAVLLLLSPTQASVQELPGVRAQKYHNAVAFLLSPTQASVREVPGAHSRKYHKAVILSLSPGKMAYMQLELPGA